MGQFVAGLAVVLLVAAAAWIAMHPRNDPAPPAMVRFQIPAPENLRFTPWDLPVVSPDGQRIAFTASNRLFVRSLNTPTTIEIPIPGSYPGSPFWSPDSQQIAFSSGGSLQRVALSGGPPVTICSNCSAWSGGTWSRAGVILSATRTALYRVAADGGVAKLLPLAQGETAQRWPEFLPDGKHYLYLSVGSAPYQAGIYAASLDSNDRKFLVANNAKAASSNAAYLQSGQLLYLRNRILVTQPFDLHSLKLSGEPRPVAEVRAPIDIFAASPNGVIVWRNIQPLPFALQWFDRSGKKLATVGEPADYSDPALSPDDRKLAVCIGDPQANTRDIWIFDLVRGGKTRLTFGPADQCAPVWSPDGTRIAFTVMRPFMRDIYWKLADRSSPEELLLGAKDGGGDVEDWSRDGKYLSYSILAQSLGSLHLLPLAGDRKPVTYLDITRAGFSTMQSQFSPNGRWVAYAFSESGLNQVYVQGFNLDPSQPRGKWQISTITGEMPRWRRDGKELYYHSHTGNWYFAVDVKTDGPSFEAGVPKPLFGTDPVGYIRGTESPYAVSGDGQRFLLLTATDDKPPSEPIEVLVNWR
jgi:Tol biopolymer transport system component